MRHGITSMAVLYLLGAGWRSEAAEPATAEVQVRLDQLEQRVEDLEDENRELRESLESNRGEGLLSGGSVGDDILISGEGGLIYLDTGREGAYPNREFRIDEARLYLDARLLRNVFFFVELNLAERERDEDVSLETGELYIDVERLVDSDAFTLTLRLGRFDIPFGEEYQVRDAHDNPLISHSLADFWGIDEGVEIYGRAGPVDYALAVQNGGVETARDYNEDKAVTLRIGGTPLSWMRVSVSAMRTGDLDVKDDRLSELWFGNGFIRSLSQPDAESGAPSADVFSAEVFQGDLTLFRDNGHVWFSGGVLEYEDDDPVTDYDRDVTFYSVEGVQDLGSRVWVAARYSRIECTEGFRIVGQGPFGVLFSPVLTTDIERLSLGAGYRWSDQLKIKAEYSFEEGDTSTGGTLENRDLVGVEVTYAF